MAQSDKVILAYSGGLDTSYCVKYLQLEKNLEVHCAIVNTGGFTDAELKGIGARAKQMGAASFKVLDYTQEFYQRCLRFLIYGNVLRNNTYPLSVSAERVFQALAIIEYAQKKRVKYIAHGSTGAGNDQIRFDLIFNILGSGLEVITPIRDLKLSRQEEVDYLKKHGVEMSWEKAQYSINKGLWGTSVGGKETLTSNQYLPESAFPSQVTATEPKEITLQFTQGQLTGINNHHYANNVEAIQALSALASPFGIGRDIHVGDTIIGIKGRVGFEAAAPLLIIKAHHLLEKHTLGKWQQYWKEQMGNWYGMMLHEGQYLDPVMRDIESFLEHTQERVNGTVFIKLYPYRFELHGVDSPHDMMRSKMGQYGEMNNAWSGEDAKGFTKIAAIAGKIYGASK
ncbi:MAG: argininosuccinate synthase [Saprospiraceae bacterium]|nr:argininosuccinate synthase [Saprospiraceae bacterium]